MRARRPLEDGPRQRYWPKYVYQGRYTTRYMIFRGIYLWGEPASPAPTRPRNISTHMKEGLNVVNSPKYPIHVVTIYRVWRNEDGSICTLNIRINNERNVHYTNIISFQYIQKLNQLTHMNVLFKSAKVIC